MKKIVFIGAFTFGIMSTNLFAAQDNYISCLVNYQGQGNVSALGPADVEVKTLSKDESIGIIRTAGGFFINTPLFEATISLLADRYIDADWNPGQRMDQAYVLLRSKKHGISSYPSFSDNSLIPGQTFGQALFSSEDGFSFGTYDGYEVKKIDVYCSYNESQEPNREPTVKLEIDSKIFPNLLP